MVLGTLGIPDTGERASISQGNTHWNKKITRGSKRETEDESLAQGGWEWTGSPFRMTAIAIGSSHPLWMCGLEVPTR